MAKVADRYFKVDPWKIEEEGFDPSYSLVGESIFSLANEYMGVRGYFEEGYSGKTLLGSYANGVYERRDTPSQGYKGIVQDSEFMVNGADWLYTCIRAAGEVLDLNQSSFRNYKRIMDMKTGLMTRSFIWKTGNGEIQVEFSRLISMVHNEQAAQCIRLTSLDYTGAVTIESGIRFDTVHGGAKESLWECNEIKSDANMCMISATTVNTKQKVSCKAVFSGSAAENGTGLTTEKRVMQHYEAELRPGQDTVLEKVIYVVTPLSKLDLDEEQAESSYGKLLTENEAYWAQVWERSDIEIEGDIENQQGIRFCIFQMYQTYHGAVEGTNIGAKGLTGEAYNGNAFWDTETYCLPFFLFHDRQAAKNLLYFRYATLEEAKKRAAALDCRGAFYPIATISGKECCNLWQHASLQLQASTAVAYGIWIYEKVTGDHSFTEEHGLTMLIEISRMLATRGAYNGNHTYYGYYGVMGPDEFQMMVNHNCYTNFMGKFTLDYTLSTIERMRAEAPEAYAKAVEETGLAAEECADWKEKADAMYIPYDEESGLYEQHKGFFDLPHIDVDAIPVEEFPLYHNWTYDRIYRNDMIKQPDVLMFMLMFNSSFSKETLEKNYDYYEPRCIHESSLSPSVHSILASQLGKEQEAFSFFQFATRMDLDNYNRNSGEGIHTTSIAAAWMNIVYGFGGLRSDGEMLSIAPSIPKEWKSYQFRIVYRDSVLRVRVKQNQMGIVVLEGEDIRIKVYGQETDLTKEEQIFEKK